MLQKIENDIKKSINELFNVDTEMLDKLVIEQPPEKYLDDFDISTNIALILAKNVNKKPIEIANEIADKLAVISKNSQLDYIAEIKILPPAFINIKLRDNILLTMVNDVIKNGDKNLRKNLGTSVNGTAEKVNVEFCSANPTGPLHIGHARGAIFGDVLSSMLEKSGYDVCREYYINDAGGQMEKLEQSIQWRIDGCKNDLPDGCYPGEYLQKIADKRKKILEKNPSKVWDKTETALEMIQTFIKPTLKKLKINFDIFSSEQKLKDKGAIEKGINRLAELGLIYKGTLEPPKGKPVEDYEPREQMLFKSKHFGDDTDRPLAKNDGSHTYFASDIAYHYDKYKRGFNNMVVVLGADHKGYVKRLTSAVKAVSNNQAEAHIKLCELVNFMKNGEMVKMSKRKNNFLTIDDVLDEIDPDILRFIILTRKADTTLNFDLFLAKEQSRENPIWYIQYAHSRCCSALRQAQNNNKINKQLNIDANIKLPKEFHLLLVKALFYTRFLELAVKNYEPYFFANYLTQLATSLHAVWSAGSEDKTLRIIQFDSPQVSRQHLSIVECIRNLLSSGLRIFNIEPMEEM